MKLLLDTCVWGGAREALAAAGHDVIWSGAWDVDPGDDEILARAHREGRVLVTLIRILGNSPSSEAKRIRESSVWSIGQLSSKPQSV